jgi:hypothetical protein
MDCQNTSDHWLQSGTEVELNLCMITPQKYTDCDTGFEPMQNHGWPIMEQETIHILRETIQMPHSSTMVWSNHNS